MTDRITARITARVRVLRARRAADRAGAREPDRARVRAVGADAHSPMTIYDYVLAQADARKRAELRGKPKLQRAGMISIAGDLGGEPIRVRDRRQREVETRPLYRETGKTGTDRRRRNREARCTRSRT
jgi:hypothetical protein